MWLLLTLSGCLGPSELPQPQPAPSLAPTSWEEGQAERSRQTWASGRIRRIDSGVRGFEMVDEEGSTWTTTVSIDGRVTSTEDEALAFEDLVVGMTVRADGRIGNGQVLASSVKVLEGPGEPEPTDAATATAPDSEAAEEPIPTETP